MAEVPNQNRGGGDVAVVGVVVLALAPVLAFLVCSRVEAENIVVMVTAVTKTVHRRCLGSVALALASSARRRHPVVVVLVLLAVAVAVAVAVASSVIVAIVVSVVVMIVVAGVMAL